MAITVASSSTYYNGSSSTIVVPKPSGLAVGDLMVSMTRGTGFGSFTPPSGWTLLSSTFNPFSFVYIHYKYADSGDVSASDFTWTDAGTGAVAGGIVRITGASPLIGSAVLAGAATNNANPSFATGVTPTRANNLLLIFIMSMQNANESLGGYAISTSNPTWTESFDIVMGTNESFSCAWAVRPQTTSTGAWSCTGGTGTSDYNSFLVSINEQFIIDVTESITLTESYLNNVGILVEDSIILTEDTEANKQRMNTNTDKSSTTWINQNK